MEQGRKAKQVNWEERLKAPLARQYFPLGFPVSHEAWAAYSVGDLLRGLDQLDERQRTAVMRRLAHQVQTVLGPQTEHPVRPGHLQTFALIVDLLRYLFDLYVRQQNPGVLGDAEDALRQRQGDDYVDVPAVQFVNIYPPHAVHTGVMQEDAYLAGAEDDGFTHKHGVLRELALLRLATLNPAFRPFLPLYRDGELKRRTSYTELVDGLESYFDEQPPLDLLRLPLFQALRAPMEAHPNDLEGQLDYIRAHWSAVLPEALLRRLLAARSALREETALRGPMGPPLLEVLGFGRGLGGDNYYPEPERFTVDASWMSSVVLMAKITYVWLDQLSKRYQREIRRLDQVPDEELDRLAQAGINGLWLIGLWERSSASEDIKKRMGNPEAAASAYSLYDYIVAGELGGEEAYYNLKDRAWQRGIRMASDMVPNHVGIHSRWVVEHPDWFIQAQEPPFPAYTFNGPDLCPDDRVGLYIEDGYYTHSDAAVVFKRVDHHTGEARYIYHGNDGTSMPWNDTAQLNYLLEEVREAVVQTILHVARLSPIIRFDAAMTLAKKHYQRLWFPLPGDGGAIPSRAEQGMTRAEFDAAFPKEFWREVVDRIQSEEPDTLLLAEAFWLMEGYFVRTLGMHRVYNSAFMNMLKLEENLKYRTTIKNVLEFSPEVLKRFVNFMSNPDELTAVEQFGKGDKYFGVAMLMATMPGLPMFGHGQFEGYTEKYGMEYRRAYWDEEDDLELLARHEREIYPLLKKRQLFSGVDNFAFYDLVRPEGWVDDNVFAYANRVGNERSLVVYNNAYQPTHGRIHTSTAINKGSGDEKDIVHVTLAESLELRGAPDVYYLFRDHRDGLHYVREGRELCEEGLTATLNGYQYHVFLDFEEVYDRDHIWAQVAAKLEGRGVPDLHREYKEIVVAPLLEAFAAVYSPAMLENLTELGVGARDAETRRRMLRKALGAFLELTEMQVGLYVDAAPILDAVGRRIEAIQTFDSQIEALGDGAWRKAWELAGHDPSEQLAAWSVPLAWAILQPLEPVLSISGTRDSAQWIDDWLLTLPMQRTLEALGDEPEAAHDDMHLAMILVHHEDTFLAVPEALAGQALEALLEDPIARDYLGAHDYEGVAYVAKERLEKVLGMLALTGAVALLADPDLDDEHLAVLLPSRLACAERIRKAAAASSYAMQPALAALEPKPRAKPKTKAKSAKKKTAAKKKSTGKG